MFDRVRRKWWLLAVLAAAGLAVPVGGWVAVRATASNRLDEVVARLDATDPGWTAAGLTAAREARLPPAGRNPYDVAARAKAAMPAGFDQAVGDRSGLPAAAPLSPGELAALTQLLAGCGPAVADARRLADLPEGGRPLVIPLMPTAVDTTGVTDLRTVGLLLQADAEAAAHGGQPAAAVRAVRAGLGVCRAVGDEPTLIAQLIRNALAAGACKSTERVLGLCEPDAGLAELQADLLREADYRRLEAGCRGERALFHGLLQFLAANTGPLDRLGGLVGEPTYQPDDHAAALDLLTGYVEAGRRPFAEQWRAVRAVPAPAPRHTLTRLLAPAVEKYPEAALRARGELLATAAGVACERHRRRAGAWPESLDAVPKDLLPAVPVDPFTGRPVVLNRLPDGVAVYSVGPDGEDDGGRFEGGADRRDYGVRLWDPGSRRRPTPAAAAPTDHP